MLKLIRLIIVLISVLSAGIVVAIVLAPPDRLPFPLNTLTVANLNNCQLPCWHGIYPGRTTLQEAEAIMDADPMYGHVISNDTATSRDWRLINTPTDYHDVVIYSNDQDIVTRITLHGYPSVGQVLEALGKPLNSGYDCATVIQLNYQFGSVYIEIPDFFERFRSETQDSTEIDLPSNADLIHVNPAWYGLNGIVPRATWCAD